MVDEKRENALARDNPLFSGNFDGAHKPDFCVQRSRRAYANITFSRSSSSECTISIR